MYWYQWMGIVVGIYLAIGFVVSMVIAWKTRDQWGWDPPGDAEALFIAMIFLWLPAGIATYFSDLRARQGW